MNERFLGLGDMLIISTGELWEEGGGGGYPYDRSISENKVNALQDCFHVGYKNRIGG